METFIFDTLAYAEKLTSAGMPEKQAKAIAEAQADILSKSILDNVATKADIKELETKMEIKMKDLEIRLIKWFAGLFIVQIGVTVGIVIAILKLVH
ncbi:MAG: CCDC90 family protein [Deltaproteobacteria bacterium]|jgi:hypothetical protein|nr:CCDC90 family protein [Deltaproteobacteria bacterium]MCL5880703.1 CCDC90 family protein [Deltaproteobacteria bacterium]